MVGVAGRQTGFTIIQKCRHFTQLGYIFMTKRDYIDSYYRHTKADGPRLPMLDGVVEAEFCVIGAGLAGLTAARELLRLGKSVVLLEENRVGWGASGRNGGFVSDGFAQDIDVLEQRLGLDHARELFDLSKLGTNYVRHAITELCAPSVHVEDGWLNVIRHSDEDGVRRHVDHMRDAYDAAYGFWSTEQVRAALVSERYFQGCEDPEAFHIQPLNYALALAEDVSRSGGQIFEGSAARELNQYAGGWRVTCEKGGEVRSGGVLLCGSGYMHDLYPKLERAVLPVATYVVTSEPMGERLENAIRYRGCIADTRRAGDYYRLVDGGDRLLWGGRITTRPVGTACFGTDAEKGYSCYLPRSWEISGSISPGLV